MTAFLLTVLLTEIPNRVAGRLSVVDFDRYRKLLDKIEEALVRIENDEYGYCEETGEPIGLMRLEARAIATLCIEAQERHENYEKQHTDDPV